MSNDFHFIGRENELSILYAIINKNGPAIGVVYGRRRVGKTELVKKAFFGKKMFDNFSYM